MKQGEAYKQIERWLLVPVDFESILPALAAIRHTDDFDEYACRVADAEYKARSVIIDAVDQWIEAHKDEPDREEVLNEKLDKLAGREKAEEQSKPKNEALDEHYRAFVNGYAADSHALVSKKKDDGSMLPCCSSCGGVLEKRETRSVESTWIVIYIVLFFFIGPFIIIPIALGKGFVQKKSLYCPKCGRTHDL